MLVRLASDTGGRLTRATNDFSLGFARIQRDLGCRYTVGFYLQRDEEDRPRRLALHVRGAGLRILHATQYKFRSESERRRSTLSAAFFAPEMFQTGYVRAHVFSLHPVTPKSWETLVAVSFPVEFTDAKNTVQVDFGGVLRQGTRVVHSFHRRVTLRPFEVSSVRERRFMFLEPVNLEPGEYELTVVTAGTEGQRPAATRIDPIPKREMMLVQPILGRPRDENIVVRGTGPPGERRRMSPEMAAALDIVATKGSFEPLLVQRADGIEELLARNKACIVGASKRVPDTMIERSVLQGDETAVELPPVALALESGAR